MNHFLLKILLCLCLSVVVTENKTQAAFIISTQSIKDSTATKIKSTAKSLKRHTSPENLNIHDPYINLMLWVYLIGSILFVCYANIRR